jgi:mono/diheme cytochrome c family protein
MSKYTSPVLSIAISIILLSACSKKQAEEPKPVTSVKPGVQVTYTAVVGPLFQARCAGCHAPGRQAAVVWSFNGYSAVTGSADKIKQAVLVNKTMPLGGTLSAADLQSLKDWFDQGMPQ